MKILFLHTDQAFSQDIKDSLEFLNYPCDLIHDCSSWNEIFSLKRHDVLITGHNHPILDCIEILKAAKAIVPEVRVIIIHNDADADLAIKAVNHHAFRLFSGKFDIRDLIVCFKEIEDEIEAVKSRETQHARLALEYAKLRQAFNDLRYKELQQVCLVD